MLVFYRNIGTVVPFFWCFIFYWVFKKRWRCETVFHQFIDPNKIPALFPQSNHFLSINEKVLFCHQAALRAFPPPTERKSDNHLVTWPHCTTALLRRFTSLHRRTNPHALQTKTQRLQAGRGN